MAYPPGFRTFRTQPTRPIGAVLPTAAPAPTSAAAQAYPIPSLSFPSPPTTAIDQLSPKSVAAPTPPPITAPAMRTVPVAPIAAPNTGLAGVGQQLKNTAASIGKTVAQNPSATASVLQGLGGIFAYGSAKDPGNMPAPKPYTPPIRGAQGMESTSYNQTRADILGSQTVASTADTSDVAANAVQRLLSQRQTNAALGGLASTNNQAYQTDRARVADQESQAYGMNYQQQGQYAQAKYAENRRLFEGRRTQSAAQVQGAIDSISAGYQAKQQGIQTKQEGTNRRTEAEITQLHTSLATATTLQEKEMYLKRLQELDPDGIRSKGAQVRYGTPKLAGGGMLPTGELKFTAGKAGKAAKTGSTTKGGLRSKTALPASVAAIHDLSKEFGRHIDRFSSQARAAFDRSIQTATRLRSSAPNTLAGSGHK